MSIVYGSRNTCKFPDNSTKSDVCWATVATAACTIAQPTAITCEIYDFLTERTEEGRQFKLLVVLDEFTREALAIEVGRLFMAQNVILTLQFLFAVRGAPQHIRSDNSPEFVAKNI